MSVWRMGAHRSSWVGVRRSSMASQAVRKGDLKGAFVVRRRQAPLRCLTWQAGIYWRCCR